MHIKQHIPNFVDGVDPEHADFSTLEELLAIPFVHQWTRHPVRDEPDKGFHRFSISPRGNNPDSDWKRADGYTDALLMCERKAGFEWWVVGYITPLEDAMKLGLPEHVAMR